jgi:hypothetical protein
MRAIEFAYNIYLKSKANAKKFAWLNEEQERTLFKMLYEEKKWNGKGGSPNLGFILPDNTLIDIGELTVEQLLIHGESFIQKVCLKKTPDYIMKNGFECPQQVILKPYLKQRNRGKK